MRMRQSATGTRPSLPVAAALLLSVAHSPAADWPRFRGPNGTGVAESAPLPAEFGPTKNLIWKTPLPPGHSSPIISGNRIFLTAVANEKLYTISLDSESGKELWRRESPRSRNEPLDKRNNAASPTPAAADGKVYVFFADYGVLAYDFEGNEQWRAPLGPFNNIYGMGASPIVAGDLVVLVCDHAGESFIVALDRKSGTQRWRTSRPEAVSGHSTPVVFQPAGRNAQILAPGSFLLDAYDAEDGSRAWWVYGLASEMKSVPVFDGDTVFINGYNTPFNDPGKHKEIPPFTEVLAKHDANHDGKIARGEAPDDFTRGILPFIDNDRDGSLDAAEWKMYIAAMAAENGLLAIRAGGSGDMTSRNVKWKYQRAVPQLPSTLLYRGVLYMINDGGILTTFDPATGDVLKQGRLREAIDHYYASPVAAGGKVFIVSQTGIVSVLKAGGEQEVIATNTLGEDCYATPAIANDRIFIRTVQALYAFGLSQ